MTEQEILDKLPERFIDTVDELSKARARIAALEAALQSVMIGGNHVALLIGADHPPYTATHEAALRHYGAGKKYEAWNCWRNIMHARDVLERR
jgi:hypothetical protein